MLTHGKELLAYLLVDTNKATLAGQVVGRIQADNGIEIACIDHLLVDVVPQLSCQVEERAVS